jgi:DMSO/TMAO reductase YedYZ heme-binding membrane subunit
MRRSVLVLPFCLLAPEPGLALSPGGADPSVAAPVMQVTGGLASLLLVAALSAGMSLRTPTGRFMVRQRARLSAAGLALTLLHLALAVTMTEPITIAAAGAEPVAALLVGVLSLSLTPLLAASRRWLRRALGAAWQAHPLAAVAGAVLLAGHGAMSLDGEGAASAWLHMLPLLLVPAVPLMRRRAGAVDAWG